MKINIALLLVFCGGFLLLPGSKVKAQEAGSPSFESYDKDYRIEREKGTSHFDEAEIQKATRSTKDSTAIPIRNVYKPSPVVPKADKTTNGQDGDDSILSFNFLYYLIQKYKMQDILE